MKKVININFQGRVIPIEDSAYEMLQQYTGSLRNYFANEEGRDEIINDIENRIGELFAEQLKRNTACITDSDIEAIMNSMGRPADFEQADEQVGNPKEKVTNEDSRNVNTENTTDNTTDLKQQTAEKKRLYRDEEDKILGGVASGLANYLGIDPTVIRILFAITAFFGGFGFLVYIILWIALPSKSLITNIRKRLYRDTEDKVFGGVCGGLAKYFDISVAIPRVIFAAPFIFGLVTSIGRNFFMSGPVFIGSFSGGTFIITYIILWIVLPEAVTASEKLEMKGEKVDLNSIRNTIMEDLQGLKGRTEKIRKEMSGSAQKIGVKAKQIGEEVKQAGKELKRASRHARRAAGISADTIIDDSKFATRRHRGGLGNAIGLIIKAFVFFIIGMIAFALFIAFIAILGTAAGWVPLKDFFLQGIWQNLFFWGTILLFVGVPVIAFIVWIIRRMMKVKAHNKYIGYGFSFLWFVGVFCVIALIGAFNRNLSSQLSKSESFSLQQPSTGKLVVAIANNNIQYYNSWGVDLDGVLNVDRDTLYLNTIRVNVVRSNDSLYHLHIVRLSKGPDRNTAETLAEKIGFNIVQKDSMIYLPENFGISKNDKWRNQRILVVIEVPVGKKIKIDNSINEYDYFNINMRNRRYRNQDFDRRWENTESWYGNEDEDLLMTNDDLIPVNRKEKKGRKDPLDGIGLDDKDEIYPISPQEPSPSAIKGSSKKKDSIQYHTENTGEDNTNNNSSIKTSIETDFFSPLSAFF